MAKSLPVQVSEATVKPSQGLLFHCVLNARCHPLGAGHRHEPGPGTSPGRSAAPVGHLAHGALADKSGNMFDFRGNTSSNRAGAWSLHEFALIFPTTQQFSLFSMSPRTSPIAASGATNVKNVIRFYLIVHTVIISSQ